MTTATKRREGEMDEHVNVLKEMLPFYAEAPQVQAALDAAIAALQSGGEDREDGRVTP